MLLDCANGATYRAAPLLFERLGAEVERDRVRARRRQHQRRLRLDAHREQIVERMREGGHDVGFAFDGDGDRVLAVARDGSVVDGDEIIAQSRCDLKRRGELQATASR